MRTLRFWICSFANAQWKLCGTWCIHKICNVGYWTPSHPTASPHTFCTFSHAILHFIKTKHRPPRPILVQAWQDTAAHEPFWGPLVTCSMPPQLLFKKLHSRGRACNILLPNSALCNYLDSPSRQCPQLLNSRFFLSGPSTWVTLLKSHPSRQADCCACACR